MCWASKYGFPTINIQFSQRCVGLVNLRCMSSLFPVLGNAKMLMGLNSLVLHQLRSSCFVNAGYSWPPAAQPGGDSRAHHGWVRGGGMSFRGLGAEQRHLMSKWQVIKINQSGYRTGAHTLLHSGRYTMQQEEKAEKTMPAIFTFTHSSTSFLVISCC